MPRLFGGKGNGSNNVGPLNDARGGSKRRRGRNQIPSSGKRCVSREVDLHNKAIEDTIAVNVGSEDTGIPSDYIDLGDCVWSCEYCKAKFWYGERLKGYSKDGKVCYHGCCGGGKVELEQEREPAEYIKQLFKNKHFLDNVRAYNQMFSMTSFGVEIDGSINNGGGPYVFKISGQIHHWIGTLCPEQDESPRFLQLYIYDTENEVANRMGHFGGEASGTLDPEVVRGLIGFLDDNNELVKVFRTARDKCMGGDVPEFQIRLYNVIGERQYDLPSSQILGGIVFEKGLNSKTDYDVIIDSKNGRPQRVSKLHPSYMSLQFPLLFVFGQPGFHTKLKLKNLNAEGKEKRMSMNMYYSYQLHDRFNLYGLLLRGGRLFQQYVVTAYCSLEQNRTDFVRKNQNDIRNEYLSGIYDAISRGDRDGSDVGTRIILPSSFTGGPRYMYSHYLDALAICRVLGNPQFFITFTCNVNWPEIKRYMADYPHLTPADRADIVCRVFEQKVKDFVKFLKQMKPFGAVAGVLYTIEFQKRGLPHCHTLLWINSKDKINQASDIDLYISAELPDPQIDPAGYKVVSEMMVHGPCGLVNPKAACMDEGNCTKNFPKKYNPNTFFDKDGYVHYRRRKTSVYTTKRKVQLDNCYIVPYNHQLCLTFHAHINVEYCGWSMLIKYLFKYISKGTDRVAARITRPIGQPSPPTNRSEIKIDEIQNFIDGRFICPHEACWRILNFNIHSREPAVQILAVHLPNMQRINFRAKQSLKSIINNNENKMTTLTEWFAFNAANRQGQHLTHIDFPSEFVWYGDSKSWKPRKKKTNSSIGRLAYVHPTSGELFYLRMLLCHQKGCKSFEDLRTANKRLLPTYRAACEALGLLGDDKEWNTALEESSFTATASELRFLFAHIITYCDVADPLKLWKTYWRQMVDDIPIRIAASHRFKKFHSNERDLESYALYELEIILNGCSKSIKDFGFPPLPESLIDDLNNRALMEEKNYDRGLLAEEARESVLRLNGDQKKIYERIVTASASGQQELIFVYGHGGTGKTFLWKTIISTLRSKGKVVLAVASSGIASLLLPAGRTAHSRFKLPLELTDESLCNIKKSTHLGDLLADTDLIIWDEAPMNDRRCFEALDRTLRDVLNSPEKLFGGKLVMLGGDFRQTLPVKKGASKYEIIGASIAESDLWPHFKVCTLTENMRLMRPGISEDERSKIRSFSKWLLQIGDGKMGQRDVLDTNDSAWITIPNKHCVPDDENGLPDLISFIYDESTLQRPNAQDLQQKAIVCPKNDTADVINSKVLEMLEGESITYVSSDEAIPVGNNGGETELLYPVEYLNSLRFPGFPPHKLEIKVGAPIMLLRNVNLQGGLCNGTRMIVTQLLSKLIVAQIITGTRMGEKIYLPRMPLTHRDPKFPFIFKRKQFPIKICYAMTINKSQGQSLNKIGIYLPEPIFGHGQLYVALSRATSPHGLKILISKQDNHPPNTTKNTVYTDFLSKILATQVLFAKNLY